MVLLLHPRPAPPVLALATAIARRVDGSHPIMHRHGMDAGDGLGAPATEPMARDGATVHRPRALLLDLDGTLLDNSGIAGAVSRTCDALAARFGGLDAGQLRRANTEVWSDYWPRVETSYWLGQVDGFAVSREAWRRTLQACGYADESVVGYAFAQYRRFSGEARRLFADAVELLSYVAKGGFRTALVTNGPSDVQRDHLRALGLQDCFGAVVISGELGVAKPDPAPFQVALARLAVDRHAAWHVGDSLATDVQGAQAAGVFAVWLNRAGTSPRPGGPHSGLEVVLKSSRSRR
jgi:HAD superfamily hydrolase (TIGR01549 family)